MKENIEDYRKNGQINLDEYFRNNPSSFTYPYYIDGYDELNFWAQVRKGDKEKYIYIKPRDEYDENPNYNVYAELVYEELIKQVGIKSASLDLGKYNGMDATFSDNILDNYNKDIFLINGSELIEGKRYLSTEESSLDDLFDAIEDYCRVEYLEKKVSNECIEDIEKICIADIFTLSTNRKATDYDFLAGKDKDGNEIFKVAPNCHNTYPLGSNSSIDDMYDMLENEDMLADRVDTFYTDSGVPENKRNIEYPYWEDSLYYLIEENPNMLNFARKCAKNMDISKAIYAVEEKIKSRIPIEYKEFMYEIFNNRLQNICECIDIDYYELIDEKEIEREEI